MTRCADTGLVPPASGVTVKTAALLAGFRKKPRLDFAKGICYNQVEKQLFWGKNLHVKETQEKAKQTVTAAVDLA